VSNPTANPSTTTTYIVTGGNGTCVNTDSVRVTVNALPNVSAGPDQSICYGTSVILSGYGAMSYAWDNGILNGVSFMPSAGAMHYTLTGTDSNGCVGYSSVNIEVFDSIDLQLSGDTAVCPNEDVELYVNGSINPIWSNGELASLINVTITNDTSFMVTDSNICGSVSKIVYVDMYALPYIDAGNDQQINYGQNTQLNATVNNVSGYSWTPAYYLDNSSVEDPIAEPEETTTFVLSVVSSNGCESNDAMTVYVNEAKVLHIPTAFTPNDDGKNDRYFISGKGICDLNISIFNRWGELIFQGSGIDASWDGTYNDEKQPLETYAVLVDIEFCDQTQKSYRNNITLIR
jgi:gliding motility-associated-like protein